MLAPIVYPGIVWLAHQRTMSDIYKRLMVEGKDVDPGGRARPTSTTRCSRTLAQPASGCTTFCNGTTLPRFAGSGHPTLILVAEHDRIVNVRRLESAIAGAPDVSFDVIRRAGHAWSPELSRRQRALIAAFLDDQPLPRIDGAAVAAA